MCQAAVTQCRYTLRRADFYFPGRGEGAFSATLRLGWRHGRVELRLGVPGMWLRREKARSLSGLEPPSTTRTTRFPLSPSGMLLSFHSREESLRWPLVPAAQLIA